MSTPETAKETDAEWAGRHVPRYSKMQPQFAECEAALQQVLKNACKTRAPNCIIQTRTKSVPGFAEKILRKRAGQGTATMVDPLVRLTDLCGGRVICQTEEQVRAVQKYVEENFEVDWENSDDAAQRLRTAEFGYRTINRIVQFKPGVFPTDLVKAELCQPVRLPDSTESMPLKMEIQIRTMLAHVWADVSHDLAYKTEVTLPAHIHRDLASKAAILEETDRDISRLVHSLNAYRSNYGAHWKRQRVQEEIALQEVVLNHVKDPEEKRKLAVEIARLNLAIGEQQAAVTALQDYTDDTDQHAVMFTLGQATLELYQDHEHKDHLRQAREYLKKAATAAGADAETHCLLGEAAILDRENNKAAEAYKNAVQQDSAEPNSLVRYLEHEVAMQRNHALVDLTSPLIREAMRRCQTQIEGCVNQPAAWGALSLMHLMVGEPHQALESLTKLMCLCETRPKSTPPRPCTAARHVLRLKKALERLKGIESSLPGFAALERAILLGLALRGSNEDARNQLHCLASWNNGGGGQHITAEANILLIAGGCSPDVESLITDLEPHFLRSFVGLPHDHKPLVLFSGGTRSGISRLAGDVAEKSGKKIQACGYLPKNLPFRYEVERSESRYAWLRSSEGNDFTAEDPLQGWTDLAAAGVPLENVKLLAFAPGEISRAEISLALALGVRVGIIDHPALPPDRQFDFSSWSPHLEAGSLVQLPLDAMSIRAFLLTDKLPEANKQFAVAAQRVHEDYLKSARPADPSLSPWDKLPDALKVSNYHQVAYWANILTTEGLEVLPLAEGEGAKQCRAFDVMAAIGQGGVRRLAEMEHGRWNVERLLLGWKWAPVKDVSKKHSPYLVPWRDLTREIQKYDEDAIVGLPANLLAAGFKVCRKS